MTFEVTTTRHGPAPFAWSFSRLKNFETCPLRHQQIDLLKTFSEDESNDALQYGGAVHKSAAERLGPDRVPLPKEHQRALGKWCDALESGPGELQTELRTALTEDLRPCGYFDADVWYRGVIDVLKLNPPVAFAGDWKTGKIVEDSVQLAVTAAWVFAQYPEIEMVRSEYIWLKFNTTTKVHLTRNHMPELWATLAPRIQAMKHAAETATYPPKPSGLCKNWCPVETCKYHGV